MRIEVQGNVDKEIVELAEATVLSLDRFWKVELWNRYGLEYYLPRVVLFDDRVITDCGLGVTQHGPFYCSGDRTVYLDPRWLHRLENEYGAEVSPLVVSYIIAHEIGHYVQSLRGVFHRILSAPGGDSMRVRGELQADYWAGSWLRFAISDKEFPWTITEDDMTDVVFAASRVGDDLVHSRKFNGDVRESRFGHGTSLQRSLSVIKGAKDRDPFLIDLFRVPNITETLES